MKRCFDVVRKVLEIAPGHRVELLIQFGTDIAYDLLCLLPPTATAGIIAVITEGKKFNNIWFYVALFILYCIFQYGALWLNYRNYAKLSTFYYNETQRRLFDHVVNNSSILDKVSRGKIVATCSEDITYMVGVIDYAADTLAGILQLCTIFFIFASHDIFVAIAAAVIDLIYIIIMEKNSRRAAHYYEASRKYSDRIIDVLNQMLGNLRQIKSLDMMPNLDHKLDRQRKSYDDAYDKRYDCLTRRYCEVPMIVQLGKIALYIYLARLVFDGSMTLDKLVLLVSYFEMVITKTDVVLERLLNLNNYDVRMNRIKNIFDYNNETELDFGDLDNDYIDGVVELSHVDFKIHNRQILKDVSFKALPNEITAIVGRPGSGKTTIVNLLYRLYRVNSGSITIDDESIYNYSKKVYSSNVSGVFQKSFAFKMSIRDNLALVNGNLKAQIEALKRVGLYKDIQRLPYGINTVLNDQDPVLTDSQIQKLAIARAILSNAEILLFDEVTSNVDPATTNDIISILKDLREDHTVIILTHKPELMRIADKVVVMKNGRVLAKGENKDVFTRCSHYRELRKLPFAAQSVNDDFIDNGDDGGYIDTAEEAKSESDANIK